MSETDIEVLKENNRQAILHRYEVHGNFSRRRSELRAQVEELEKRIASQLKDEFGEKLAEAERAVEETKRALEIATENAAREANAGPYPIGTKLYEWVSVFRFSREKKLSGRAGIVEVWGVNSTGKKIGTGGYPNPGDFVVRVLKKDGTLGSLFEVLGEWSWWKPEGEKVK